MRRWLAALVFVATAAEANDLIVERQTLTESETTTITLSLEGDFASRDSVTIPVQNLAFLGEPWVSSEFSWINGDMVRRKVFRYRVRPQGPGVATVGPLTIDAGGQRETLPQIVIRVEPDRAAGTTEPEAALRELMATGRDPFFVIPEIDKSSVFVGEQFTVTWMLYNAANVQQWQVGSSPKLEDFWSEEVDVRRAVPERVFVGDVMMQRMPVRRLALYPLRSGRFVIKGMTIDGAIMRRIRSGPFAMFEGNLVNVSFTSAPLTIDVKPLPAGVGGVPAGDFQLQCAGPDQKNGGPVVVQATLSGTGNVRAAVAPRFEGSIAGNVQVEAGAVAVDKTEGTIAMSRRWRYLIFPRAAGELAIPALSAEYFDPVTATKRELRCAAATLYAEVSLPPRGTAPPAAVQRTALARRAVPWVAGGILLALFGALAIPRWRRESRINSDVRYIVSGTPAEIRERAAARIGGNPRTLLSDRTERGDAWRSLHSLLEAVEHDRDIAEGAEEEIARRVRELLRVAR